MDLNYSGLLTAFDEDDFIRCGPGCVAGINLYFDVELRPGNAGDMLLAGEVVRHCVDHQESYFQALGLAPVTLAGRRLKLIDGSTHKTLFAKFPNFPGWPFPNFIRRGPQ